MINTNKPTTSVTNNAKPFNGVAWDTWTVAWEDETRTWDELAEIMQNTSKPSSSITNSNRPS
jgi:hypothetical protein